MKTPACPTCFKETGQLFPINNTIGGGKCTNNSTHAFLDMGELLKSNPPMVDQASKLAPQAAPAGSVSFPVTIPGELKVKLDERFGPRLNATAASLLSSLLDPLAFIVGSEDAKRIEEKTGQKVNTGSKVVGVISDLVQAKTLAEEQAKAKKSTPAAGGLECTGFTKVEIDHLTAAALKVGANGPERLVEAIVKQAIKKGMV